jgi:hypothetical protein
MKQKNPTYLLIRNGIYYFQLRIPKHIKNDYDDKTFIRCSLKTSCRLTAVAALPEFECQPDTRTNALPSQTRKLEGM